MNLKTYKKISQGSILNTSKTEPLEIYASKNTFLADSSFSDLLSANLKVG